MTSKISTRLRRYCDQQATEISSIVQTSTQRVSSRGFSDPELSRHRLQHALEGYYYLQHRRESWNESLPTANDRESRNCEPFSDTSFRTRPFSRRYVSELSALRSLWKARARIKIKKLTFCNILIGTRDWYPYYF